MKFSTLLATAVVVLAGLTHASADIVSATPTSLKVKASDATVVMTPEEALQAAQKTQLPAGIKLTGTTEPIHMPASASTNKEATTAIASDNQEQFFGGLGGYGGWGGWGGFGGFGAYRFGYSCGGLGGWAYPLGYWNAFGAGLWGGGCGLGLAYGGLFYC